jgi:CHASE3 domain sensor protein
MTFKQKLFMGVGTALAVLIFIGVLAYRAMIRSRDDVSWVTHTPVVLEHLGSLRAAALTAESTGRGYLLTGDPSYLPDYTAALASARQELRDIRTLTSDNPVQQHALDVLSPLVESRFTTLADVVSIRNSPGLDAAVRAAAEGTGQRTMSQVNATLTSMRTKNTVF